MTAGSRRFRFVQFEFPWPLGPEPGRYLIREHLGDPPAHVLVLSALVATQRHLLLPRRRRRRPRAAAPRPEPVPVHTTRATLIDAAPLGDAQAAARWLDATDLDALADDAVARLNRILHAHRVAAADAYVREVARGEALVVRAGFGSGDDVADGAWERARELPAAPAGGRRGARRLAALRPQERLAALLAGRDAALACEELTLRARADVDAGRLREAALQLQVAHAAALAELEPWRELLANRLDELRARRTDVEAVAAAALEGGLDDEQIATVAAVLARVEAALRARSAARS